MTDSTAFRLNWKSWRISLHVDSSKRSTSTRMVTWISLWTVAISSVSPMSMWRKDMVDLIPWRFLGRIRCVQSKIGILVWSWYGFACVIYHHFVDLAQNNVGFPPEIREPQWVPHMFSRLGSFLWLDVTGMTLIQIVEVIIINLCCLTLLNFLAWSEKKGWWWWSWPDCWTYRWTSYFSELLGAFVRCKLSWGNGQSLRRYAFWAQ